MRVFVTMILLALLCGTWYFTNWWAESEIWCPSNSGELTNAVIASGLLSIGVFYRLYGGAVLFITGSIAFFLPLKKGWISYLAVLPILCWDIPSNLVGASEKLWLALDCLALVLVINTIRNQRLKLLSSMYLSVITAFAVMLMKALEISFVGFASFMASNVIYQGGFEGIVLHVILPSMLIAFGMQAVWLFLAGLVTRISLPKAESNEIF